MPDARKSMRKREEKRTAQASFSGKLPPRKPKNIDVRQREYLTKNQGQARTNPPPCPNIMGCEEARRGPSQWEHLTTHLRPASQEVFDGHEGLFAAKVKSGEPFFLRLSKYLTSL
jgi:hypothetical protein